MIVEHYLLPSRRKILPKTRLYYYYFFVYLSFGEEKNRKTTANAALTYDAIFLQAANVQKQSKAR